MHRICAVSCRRFFVCSFSDALCYPILAIRLRRYFVAFVASVPLFTNHFDLCLLAFFWPCSVRRCWILGRRWFFFHNVRTASHAAPFAVQREHKHIEHAQKNACHFFCALRIFRFHFLMLFYWWLGAGLGIVCMCVGFRSGAIACAPHGDIHGILLEKFLHSCFLARFRSAIGSSK